MLRYGISNWDGEGGWLLMVTVQEETCDDSVVPFATCRALDNAHSTDITF